MENILNNPSTSFDHWASVLDLDIRPPPASLEDLQHSPRGQAPPMCPQVENEEEEMELPAQSPKDRSAESPSSCSDQDSESELDDPALCKAGLRLLTSNAIMELPQEDVVLCINAGGRAVKDTLLGMGFEDDMWFVGGDVLRTEENFALEGPCIYQSARYGGDFCYNIKNLPAGDYLVDLHFAEIVFTNGPPGMRVFDVFIQDQKILSELDIYGRVGSNTPLVLIDARAKIEEGGELSVRFRSVIGSPIVCGFCIRKQTLLLGGETEQQSVASHDSLRRSVEMAKDNAVEDVNDQVQRARSGKNWEQRRRRKTPRRVDEYERKIKELTREYELKKIECHEAWMSLDDCNRQVEKLRAELDSKSFHVDSLDQALEGQASKLRELQCKYEAKKKFWSSSAHDLRAKIQILKQDYIILSEEAHSCAGAIPDLSGMTSAVQDLVLQCEDLKTKYTKESMERKMLYNKVLELKGNIRVFCRCRPLSREEISAGASSVVEFDTLKDNELGIRVNGTSKKAFKFDRVFTPQDDQVAVFADTAPVAVSVLDGYNVCIFAYGQTGTGKTFTMEGTEVNRGVNYRTLEKLFQVASERNGLFKYDISVSVLEVYNEQIRDLLASPLQHGQTVKKLEIKQVAEGVHHVPGLVEAQVHTMSEVWEVLQTGSSARAVGATNANEHSSRSHCILCVMVRGESLISGECTRSKLWLVDLAGSERIAKTDVQGDRLKEAQSINKSLSALGDVISALATKNSHIPYRNSKLTHLLQDSLGGDAKTLMFVQISPNESDAGETLSSLNFATRVRGIELGPAKKQLDSSELLKYKQMFDKAKQEGRSKDDMIRKMEENTHNLDIKLKGREQLCRQLQEKVKELEEQLEIRLKEQQKQSEKENTQYFEKLKEREQICRNLEEKVNELEVQLEAKVKEEQQLFQKLSEKSSEDLRRSITENTLKQKIKELEEQLEAKVEEQQILLKKLSDKPPEDLRRSMNENTLKQKVKELEDQLNAKAKEQQLLSENLCEKPPLVHQLEDSRNMNENTPYRMDQINPVDPFPENTSGLASKDNVIANNKMSQERESLTKMDPIEFNGKLDDPPSKSLPKGSGRSSCPIVRKASATSTVRRATAHPLPARKIEISEQSFLNKTGGVGNNVGHTQQCDKSAVPVVLRGLNPSNTLNRVRNGMQSQVQARGPNATEETKKRKAKQNLNEETRVAVSGSSLSGEQNLPPADNSKIRHLSTAKATGKTNVVAQKVIRGKEGQKLRGWTR